MFKKIQKYLIAGILVITPLYITIFILWFAISYFDGIFRKLFGLNIPGLGIVIGFIILLVIGRFTSFYIFQRFQKWFDHFIDSLPIIGDLYGTIKEFAKTVTNKETSPFRHVVLIKFPSADFFIPGFLTNEAAVIFSKASGKDLISVFIATTPTPISGFLVLVPRENVIIMDIEISEGLKFIVSAGIINPEKRGDKPISEPQ